MEQRKTGLVIGELSYKDGKEKINPIIDFSLVKKFRIRRFLFYKDIEVEFA